MDRSVEAGEESDEQVVEDLEDGDEAEAHGEAEEAARVGHEADEGDLLVALDPRDHRVADVDVDEGQVPPGVHEQLLPDLGCCSGGSRDFTAGISTMGRVISRIGGVPLNLEDNYRRPLILLQASNSAMVPQ